jgi:hypothetical protein
MNVLPAISPPVNLQMLIHSQNARACEELGKYRLREPLLFHLWSER